MMFATVKTALVQLLGDAAEGRFRVIGYQRQSKGSDETLGNDRLVQVYYGEGDFPKGISGTKSPKHELTMNIDLTASAKAKGDISALLRDDSTAQEKAVALLSVREAAEMADVKMDELIGYVYGILMDARNIDIGLIAGEISSRWVNHITKDTIIDRGDLVVKTANIKYTCRVAEDIAGDIGKKLDPAILNSQITVDDKIAARVYVENS